MDRISSLDVLRGFALLGIIVMNVQAFSMPIAAYFNPTAYGSLEGSDGAVWLVGHVLVDQKFMNLFSMLFGAGIVLFTARAEARGKPAGRLHLKRNLWLLAFGLAHAYLLWYGDVLAMYAVVGLALYPLRRLAARTLAIAGVSLFAVGSVASIAMGATFASWPADMQAEAREDWEPGAQTVDAEEAAYRGGWSEQMAHRVPEAVFIHTAWFLTVGLWRVGGLMLLGMALFKWGVLSAERSPSFYARLAVVGFGLGLPLVGYGVVRNFAAGWRTEYSMFFGSQFNYWGALFVALGYLGLVMLACRASALPRVRGWLANVGRTAFSSYLLQTIAMTTIFYGHGLGLFGELSRTQQVLVAAAVVVANVVASTLWLRAFRMGPFEWAWRSLTYGRVQPLRGSEPAPA